MKAKKKSNYQRGGPVSGPGTPTSDSVLARVSNGEYVLPAEAVPMIGIDALERIRQAALARRNGYADGGMIDQYGNDLSLADSMNRASATLASMRQPVDRPLVASSPWVSEGSPSPSPLAVGQPQQNYLASGLGSLLSETGQAAKYDAAKASADPLDVASGRFDKQYGGMPRFAGGGVVWTPSQLAEAYGSTVPPASGPAPASTPAPVSPPTSAPAPMLEPQPVSPEFAARQAEARASAQDAARAARSSNPSIDYESLNKYREAERAARGGIPPSSPAPSAAAGAADVAATTVPWLARAAGGLGMMAYPNALGNSDLYGSDEGRRLREQNALGNGAPLPNPNKPPEVPLLNRAITAGLDLVMPNYDANAKTAAPPPSIQYGFGAADPMSSDPTKTDSSVSPTSSASSVSFPNYGAPATKPELPSAGKPAAQPGTRPVIPADTNELIRSPDELNTVPRSPISDGFSSMDVPGSALSGASPQSSGMFVRTDLAAPGERDRALAQRAEAMKIQIAPAFAGQNYGYQPPTDTGVKTTYSVPGKGSAIFYGARKGDGAFSGATTDAQAQDRLQKEGLNEMGLRPSEVAALNAIQQRDTMAALAQRPAALPPPEPFARPGDGRGDAAARRQDIEYKMMNGNKQERAAASQMYAAEFGRLAHASQPTHAGNDGALAAYLKNQTNQQLAQQRAMEDAQRYGLDANKFNLDVNRFKRDVTNDQAKRAELTPDQQRSNLMAAMADAHQKGDQKKLKALQDLYVMWGYGKPAVDSLTGLPAPQ